MVGSLDDFDIYLRHYFRHGAAKQWALIATIGVEPQQEWIKAEQRRHDEFAAIAILNVGGVHDGVDQQALRIDENVAFLALDLFSRIVTRRIDRSPPYMGRLKSSANSWCFLFSCHSYWRLGGDRPTPIDPHESGGGGRSLDLEQHSDTRWSPLSS